MEENKKYWLIRSTYNKASWETVLKRGHFTLRGLKNFQASRSISQMQPGDFALFYETEPSKKIAGILEVKSFPYPDPTIEGENFFSIDFEIHRSLSSPLSISTMKQIPVLANHNMLKQPRVFALPVEEEVFQLIDVFSESQVILNHRWENDSYKENSLPCEAV